MICHLFFARLGQLIHTHIYTQLSWSVRILSEEKRVNVFNLMFCYGFFYPFLFLFSLSLSLSFRLLATHVLVVFLLLLFDLIDMYTHKTHRQLKTNECGARMKKKQQPTTTRTYVKDKKNAYGVDTPNKFGRKSKARERKKCKTFFFGVYFCLCLVLLYVCEFAVFFAYFFRIFFSSSFCLLAIARKISHALLKKNCVMNIFDLFGFCLPINHYIYTHFFWGGYNLRVIFSARYVLCCYCHWRHCQCCLPLLFICLWWCVFFYSNNSQIHFLSPAARINLT